MAFIARLHGFLTAFDWSLYETGYCIRWIFEHYALNVNVKHLTTVLCQVNDKLAEDQQQHKSGGMLAFQNDSLTSLCPAQLRAARTFQGSSYSILCTLRPCWKPNNSTVSCQENRCCTGRCTNWQRGQDISHIHCKADQGTSLSTHSAMTGMHQVLPVCLFSTQLLYL